MNPLRSPSLSRPLAVAATMVFASFAGAQTVHVGPPGSGAAYASIQDGIDAAPPGGVVLVAAGNYAAPATLSIDKPLTVLGAGANNTSFTASRNGASAPRLPLLVTDVPAGGRVVVAGLSLYSEWSILAVAHQSLVVQDCAGTVVLSDLVSPGGVAPFSHEAVGVVRDSANVMIERCRLGGTTTGSVLPMTPALLVQRSLVHLNASVLQGQSPSYSTIADGAPGVVAIDATVRIARSDVRGGLGSRQFGPFIPTVTTVGGAAVDATSSQVLVRGGPGNLLRGGAGGVALVNGVLVPGAGGPAIHLDALSLAATTPDTAAQAGPDGDWQVTTPPIDGPGLHAPLASVLPTIAASSPLVAPGATAWLALGGEPGAVGLPICALRASTGFALPDVLGLFALDPAGMVILPATTISVAGGGASPLTIPPTNALLGTIVHAQLLSFGPSGWVAVSGPAAFAVR